MEASNDDRVPDANAGAIRDILRRWTAGKAIRILDEVECRLRLMTELRDKLRVVGVKEVQELQPLFERGLWMLGPQFESVQFTANAGMTSVIQDLLDCPEGKGSRNRPDLVVLPDSSLGLYSCSSFDDTYEADGVDQLVVIELKTTGRVIDGRDREQVWNYIKELEQAGHLKPGTRVDGYIFGSRIAKGENRFTVYSPTIRIRPMLYATLLIRAEKRLLNLYHDIKDAPFLKSPEPVVEARVFEAESADAA
ncbi:hypothetical protein [Mitsuaria sp. GD03876]|uniref:hypothetical protein n=1 Tax=Mitsuaria sp. GD03876 TaxID=2975399 RepID=UPI0024479AE1|nr:hypothetical protein [Mitsuaria sp. GD03876]MDH0862929.1 hypothetical protein [Mitsuaria sp. GD03876]